MNVARNYLSMAVESATPLGLVVLLYDIVIDSINGALRALEAGDIERRTNRIGRALAAVGELQAALDETRGGEVAVQLGRFYTVHRERLLDAHVQASAESLAAIAGDFRSVREAWKEIERSAVASAPLAGMPADRSRP